MDVINFVSGLVGIILLSFILFIVNPILSEVIPMFQDSNAILIISLVVPVVFVLALIHYIKQTFSRGGVY